MTESIAFTRILFPTDFAASSKEAQRYAMSLARALKTSVHLLHAIEPIELGGERDAEVDDFYQKVSARAESLIETLALEFRELGIETTQEVSIGRRWEVIVKSAEAMRADLIVMGTSGIRIQDNQVQLGSTSHRVPFLAPCPVMVVRDSTTPSPVQE